MQQLRACQLWIQDFNSIFFLLQIFPGKLLIGINDSKELCYLHLTNPINHDVLTEGTRLAEVKCLERINWIKDLVTQDDEKRNVPIYLKKDGPRTTGTVVDISSLTSSDTQTPNEHRMSKLSLTPQSRSKSKNQKQKLTAIPTDEIIMTQS